MLLYATPETQNDGNNVIRDLRLIFLFTACALTTVCGDPFQPILSAIPDARETMLIDFEGGDLVDPAAYDMFTGSAVRTDQTNAWDFVFRLDADLGPVLVPRSDFLDEESTAGLQEADLPFETLDEAPADGYTTDVPVPIREGMVFTVISRKSPQTSVRCRLFGKLEVKSIEGTPAQVTLNAVVNPNCERRELIDDTSN